VRLQGLIEDRALGSAALNSYRRGTMPAKVPGQSARRPPRLIERPALLFRGGAGGARPTYRESSMSAATMS
jgi:hypothetical protein